MVTGDTNDTTFGKFFRRGARGDVPKSALPSVTCHLTWPTGLLVKNWGCVLAIILNLVQRQKEKGEGSTHNPWKMTGSPGGRAVEG
jgi:hypothetical protein